MYICIICKYVLYVYIYVYYMSYMYFMYYVHMHMYAESEEVCVYVYINMEIDIWFSLWWLRDLEFSAGILSEGPFMRKAQLLLKSDRV